MIDVRFPTTLQMMLSLALAEEEGGLLLNSSQLAEGAGTSPTLVRRLLPSLASSGLIVVAKGREGGVRLARSAKNITLRDIYVAVFAGEPIWNARTNVPHRCLVSSNINAFFMGLTSETEEVILNSLQRRTLAGSLDALREASASAMHAQDTGA